MIQILHNNRCSKSRCAVELLEKEGKKFEIIEYLKEPLNETQLSELIEKLGISAESLLRKNEQIFKEKYKGKNLDEKGWIKAMVENPKLIERPIVINGKKAIVGRPPEKILEII